MLAGDSTSASGNAEHVSPQRVLLFSSQPCNTISAPSLGTRNDQKSTLGRQLGVACPRRGFSKRKSRSTLSLYIDANGKFKSFDYTTVDVDVTMVCGGMEGGEGSDSDSDLDSDADVEGDDGDAYGDKFDAFFEALDCRQ